MSRSWAVVATLVTACGGRSTGPTGPMAAPGPEEPALQPTVAGQQWYRATTTCAQGPYELDVSATGAKWGEEFELRLHTPRKIALHAELLVDGQPADAANAVYDGSGATGGKAENARCIADARERLVLGRTGTGTGTGTATTTPGTLVVPPRPTATAQLELDGGDVTTSFQVLKISLRDRPPGARITIRFWSIEPNDLEGVLFGIAHIEWRPNVSEAEYEAFLTARVERERRATEEAARAEDERRRRAVVVTAPVVTVKQDPEAVRRGMLEAERIRAQWARERLERQRKAAEESARWQIEAALREERRLRRKQFCATHPKDRGCWGAGGYAIHAEFERHRGERAEYCAAHQEDARCWTGAEWKRRTTVWTARLDAALAPPKQPDGPPPAALVEEQPPRLSAHAEWRPGYWEWTAAQWVWLAGMWRVPDEDIASEQTTTAPAAPPPLRDEAPPSAPVATAVWLPGFWQWNGTGWVWIAGSYQLRPEPRVTWRAAEWRPRGSVHVLIPGGWVRIGGGR